MYVQKNKQKNKREKNVVLKEEKKEKFFNFKCFRCHQQGHRQAQCPLRKVNNSSASVALFSTEVKLITLRYTAPVKCLFWKRLQMITIGERLVKLLVDLNFENHPIIIHCFSNGGAFLYQNFSLALEKSPKPIQIKGVIFDSAPGKRRIVSLFRAISAILGGKPLYNIPMSVLMTMFLSMIWLYEVISNYINPKTTFQSNPLENLKNEKNTWPQHFIYSKKDVLIPFTDIEYFADYRRSLGVDVTSLCYEGSPHVKHYTEHKESYVNSVCNFLNKCLNGTN
ncbi:hypothetical protein Zmor_006261 [Zophobas morio]|uniref:CCHC-type domain-containing protein n=1 Tax=Zophobas morio TaxID=2755281 RepID=A0AA38MN83_9CUCU|nr:hypothetical protein Zmor_006261 [Zophobas morio]